MIQPHLESVLEDISQVETLEQAVEVFIQVGLPARGKAANTRRSYQQDLRMFTSFCDARGVTHLEQVRLSLLESYQAAMERHGYESSTRNRRTHTLKTFFTYLYEHHVTPLDLGAKLIPPPRTIKERRFLSEDEYQRLIRATQHHPRDAVLIELLLQTGMKLSEVAGLHIDDIHLPTQISPDPDDIGIAHVKRTGGRVEGIPLNYKVCRALASYLAVRSVTDSTAVFITRLGTGITPRSIENIVSKYLKEAAILNASVHTLRHTMATHHIAHGTDLKTVQETLGHVSLESTAVYVALAKKAQRKALQEHAL